MRLWLNLCLNKKSVVNDSLNQKEHEHVWLASLSSHNDVTYPIQLHFLFFSILCESNIKCGSLNT